MPDIYDRLGDTLTKYYLKIAARDFSFFNQRKNMYNGNLFRPGLMF